MSECLLRLPVPRHVRYSLLLAAGLCLSPARVQANEPVFLRGHRVAPQDVVFGMIDRIKGESAVLNLGSAHGVRPGLTLLVVRTVLNDIMPVGGLFVTAAEENYSEARVEGPFRPQTGDFVLIRASQLDLWNAKPRTEQLLIARLARRRTATGYSTLDASPQLIDEIARDDDFQGRQYINYREGAFAAEAARKLGPLESRLGAVSPIPQLQTLEQAEATARVTEADVTLEMLGRFAEIANTPELLQNRMSPERLARLTPLTPGMELSDTNRTLIQQILVSWANKALRPAR